MKTYHFRVVVADRVELTALEEAILTAAGPEVARVEIDAVTVGPAA